MDILIASNVVLWIVVATLILVVLALARQIGVLYERIAPMGALVMEAGPRVNDPAPSFTLTSVDGRAIALGGTSSRNTLLFFLSPDCPVCKKLIPILRSLRQSERDHLDVVLASDGETAEHLAFIQREKLESFPYVLSQDLGMAYRVSKLPFAVLLDRDGILRAKGLVNNREQIESLLTAHDLGVSSAQEYLARKNAVNA